MSTIWPQEVREALFRIAHRVLVSWQHAQHVQLCWLQSLCLAACSIRVHTYSTARVAPKA